MMDMGTTACAEHGIGGPHLLEHLTQLIAGHVTGHNPTR
jgi:hypothetical protein